MVEEELMDADDLRRLAAFLQDRVRFQEGGKRVAFALPSDAEMLAAGVHPDAVRQLGGAPWRDEFVADVVETPALCEPDDPPEVVLGYARDVVLEYVRKRMTR
jgi:hypothetical protein